MTSYGKTNASEKKREFHLRCQEKNRTKCEMKWIRWRQRQDEIRYFMMMKICHKDHFLLWMKWKFFFSAQSFMTWRIFSSFFTVRVNELNWIAKLKRFFCAYVIDFNDRKWLASNSIEFFLKKKRKKTWL